MTNPLSADMRARFELLAEGLTGREIGRRLMISAASASRLSPSSGRGCASRLLRPRETRGMGGWLLPLYDRRSTRTRTKPRPGHHPQGTSRCVRGRWPNHRLPASVSNRSGPQAVGIRPQKSLIADERKRARGTRARADWPSIPAIRTMPEQVVFIDEHLSKPIGHASGAIHAQDGLTAQPRWDYGEYRR